MAGEARTTVHDEYVLVHVRGEPLSPAEIKSTLKQALGQAVELNLHIIIFREKPVKQLASTMNFHSWASLLGVSDFRNRLALVFPWPMHADNLEFFANASKNYGRRLRLFSSMEEAQEWLDSDSYDFGD